MAFVSVVVPTRNRSRLLGRTLRSICTQQAIDFEVVVVDDGSTEDTAAVVAAADAHIKVIRNPRPSGVSVARNLGIAAASGDWIAFCDDDDLWAPDKLSSQLAAAEEARAGWVYSGDVNIDSQSRVLFGAPPPSPAEVASLLRRRNPLTSGSSNVVVRADVLAAKGGFDPGLRRTEDWDLWLRLLSTGHPAWVCRPLVAYRFHSTNIVTDVGGMVEEAGLLARRYGIPIDIPAMHRWAAWTALRGGRRRQAIGHYARAVAQGDFRSLARAAVALVHPAVGSNALFRLVPGNPAWVAEAERWLVSFVETSDTAPPADRGRQ